MIHLIASSLISKNSPLHTCLEIFEIYVPQSFRPWPDGLFSGASSLSTQQRREGCDDWDGWELCDVRLEIRVAGWCFFKITNPRENGHPKRKRIFQPSIVRRYVSFRAGKVLGFLGGKQHQEVVVVLKESGLS